MDVNVEENGCSTIQNENSLKPNCDTQNFSTRTSDCLKDSPILNKNGYRIVKSENEVKEVDSDSNKVERDCLASSCIDTVLRNDHADMSSETNGALDSDKKLDDLNLDSTKSNCTLGANAISDSNSQNVREKDGIADALLSLSVKDNEHEKTITFVPYKSEEQLPDLVALITIDLSEPYSIYTYRYFLHNWPHLSHLAYCGSECVGAIVCKLDVHRKSVLRGYIAMLVVHKSYRRCKIGSSLVKKAIRKMIEHGCDEVVLETEVTNKAALQLYENLGFVRDKRLLRYYLNGVDAWRLKLWLK